MNPTSPIACPAACATAGDPDKRLRLLVMGADHRNKPTGAAYGAGYYVAIDSLALPLYFGDVLPWQLGAATVLPRLVGHVAYGAVVALAARRFLARRGGAAAPRLTRLNRPGARAVYLGAWS